MAWRIVVAQRRMKSVQASGCKRASSEHASGLGNPSLCSAACCTQASCLVPPVRSSPPHSALHSCPQATATCCAQRTPCWVRLAA